VRKIVGKQRAPQENVEITYTKESQTSKGALIYVETRIFYAPTTGIFTIKTMYKNRDINIFCFLFFLAKMT